MTFVNAMMLSGGLLVAIPIVLHLMMRRQPRHVIFPAIRFLQQREESNRRRLRFRHWLLLAARCAAICLLAAALAQPNVKPAATQVFVLLAAVVAVVLVVALVLAMVLVGGRNKPALAGMGVTTALLLIAAVLMLGWLRRNDGGLGGGSEAPVAAALVFDTSPRMQYRQNNQTRVEAAAELGLWLVSQLPDESEIGVYDSQAEFSAPAVDRGAARRRIETIKPTAAARPLPDVLSDAIAGVAESPLGRKEVYVFTDMARTGWPAARMEAIRRQIDNVPDVHLYVVDVGVQEPVNFALGDIELSSQTTTAGGALHLVVDVLHTGPGGSRTIELRMETPGAGDDVDAPDVSAEPDAPEGTARQRQIRDRKTVELAADAADTIRFSLPGLAVGSHQGQIRIVGEDGLSWDDERYFTVRVRRPWPVLIAAPDPAGERAQYLVQAIAPSELRRRGEARFEPAVATYQELSEETLTQYAAVFLLDPPPLADSLWQQAVDYTRGGGSVAVILGRRAALPGVGNAASPLNRPAAQELLPADLRRVWRAPTDDGFYLVMQNLNHPMLEKFKEIEGLIPWAYFPVLKYWQLDALPAGVRVIATYSSPDNHPAIIEHLLGRGRVVTMTTPISDHATGGPWNFLPTAEAPWPFVVLANEMTLYLVDHNSGRLNFRTGESAVLTVEGEQSQVVVKTPPGRVDYKQTVDPRTRQLTIRLTDAPGNYRIEAGGAAGIQSGFSVNIPADESRLQRLLDEQLAGLLDPAQFKIARTRDQLVGEVRLGRVGIRLYPWLALALALILAAEGVMSNWFYGRKPHATGSKRPSIKSLLSTPANAKTSETNDAGDPSAPPPERSNRPMARLS